MFVAQSPRNATRVRVFGFGWDLYLGPLQFPLCFFQDPSLGQTRAHSSQIYLTKHTFEEEEKHNS